MLGRDDPHGSTRETQADTFGGCRLKAAAARQFTHSWLAYMDYSHHICSQKKLLLECVRNIHKAAQMLLVHLKDTWTETVLNNTGPSLQIKWSFPFCSHISRKSSVK